MPALVASIRRFAADQRGNLAVIFALACLPLLSAVGCAVDYSRAVQVKGKLQAAADAASLGSIARSSKALAIAARMNYDGPIWVGAADAQSFFAANVAGVPGFSLESLTPDVRKTGQVVTSTVTFSATIPTYFLGIMGMKNLTVTGHSVAQVNVPIVFQRVAGRVVYDSSPRLIEPGPNGAANSGSSSAQTSQLSTTARVRRNP
jgi:Flp pilus assembly protein TadG